MSEIVLNDVIKNICDQINFRATVQQVQIEEHKTFDPFDVPDQEEPESAPVSLRSWICPDCNIEMYISTDGLVCDKCGYIDESLGTTSETTSDVVNSYNTSSDSAAPVRITGPGHYKFQKKLVTDTSNYEKTRRKNTIDQMMNTVYQCPGAVPPRHIIMEAAEMYLSIQKHCIKRGDVRRGAMADCIYKICMLRGFIRKPKEIAAMFGIPQNELSNGAKIVDELIACGKIAFKKDIETNLPEHIMSSCLNQYFQSLRIPEDKPKYRHFVERLIKFAGKFGIADSSIISSKCAGAIYVLSIKCPELNITLKAIERDCHISKSTFTRFYKAISDILDMTPESEFDQKMRARLLEIFRKSRISSGR